jgi:hypothetical protein
LDPLHSAPPLLRHHHRRTRQSHHLRFLRLVTLNLLLMMYFPRNLQKRHSPHCQLLLRIAPLYR